MPQQLHFKPLNAAVLHRVAQRFLQRAEQAQRNIRRQPARNSAVLEVDDHLLMVCQFLAEPAHSRHDPEEFQSWRVQIPGKRGNVRGNFRSLLAQLLQALAQLRLCVRSRVHESLQLDT